MPISFHSVISRRADQLFYRGQRTLATLLRGCSASASHKEIIPCHVFRSLFRTNTATRAGIPSYRSWSIARRDCEIIVVHNGNYADPYALGDEVLLVEETTANPVALLNAGLMLACAPVICVLANGAMVHDDAWAEDACQRLQCPSRLASLALPVQAPAGVSATYGLIASIDGCQLQAGGIDQLQPGPTAGPQLSGGFYHRRTLLSLGGWNECVAWENADVELALLMSRLELPSELSQGSAVALPKATQRLQSHLAIKQLAELSVAYGLTPAGAGAAMSDLLRGCLSGHVPTAVA